MLLNEYDYPMHSILDAIEQMQDAGAGLSEEEIVQLLIDFIIEDLHCMIEKYNMMH